MSNELFPETSEHRWKMEVGLKTAGTARVLSICGPSGVGKTTVVEALAKNYPAFIETTKDNSHLKILLRGGTKFNASASQKWFLQRTGRHILHANPSSPLILDQDPAAIVLAYARMFVGDGQMTQAQYTSLLERLLKIEQKLHHWTCPRIVLFLDAPADVLRQRILRRWGKSCTPPLKWFERVRNHFVKLFTCFPNAITASTVKLSPEQIVSRAKSLIERNTKDGQA